MLRLTQTFGAHAGRTCEFDLDVVRFGRLPSNDLAFDAHADLDASGLHAEIRREAGQWVLVDVGSRNGTLVDGQVVQRHTLRGGEEIEFGAGGPRVRVELLATSGSVRAPLPGPGSGAGGRGVPTAPATPLEPPGPPPSWYPSAPTASPAGSPSQGGAPIPPSAYPPPPASTSPPPSTSPPSVAPKLYGQRTVESMIQSARAEAAEQARGQTPPPQNPAASSQYIRDVAKDAAGRSSRPMLFALVAVVLLFVLVLCAMSGVVVVLASRAYGGPL